MMIGTLKRITGIDGERLSVDYPWSILLRIYFSRLVLFALVVAVAFTVLILLPYLYFTGMIGRGVVGLLCLGTGIASCTGYVLWRRRHPAPSEVSWCAVWPDERDRRRLRWRVADTTLHVDYGVWKEALNLVYPAAKDRAALAYSVVRLLEYGDPETSVDNLARLWAETPELSELPLRYLEYLPGMRLRAQSLREAYYDRLSLQHPVCGQVGVVPASMAKRALDITVSLGVLVACAPLAGLIAAYITWRSLIRRDQPDIIFKKGRVGLAGGRFLEYRFRLRPSEAASPNSIRTTFRNSLAYMGADLYPSWYNVLRGDMSLIGPKPLHRSHYAQLLKWGATEDQLLERLAVKPGLCSLAQIHALLVPGGLDCLEYLKLDLQYVRDARKRKGVDRLMLDMRLAFRSVLAYVTRPALRTDVGRIPLHEDEDLQRLWSDATAQAAPSW